MGSVESRSAKSDRVFDISILDDKMDVLIDAQSRLRGEIIIRGESEAYEKARCVWNRCVDKYPYVVVKCIGASDVVIALRLAKVMGVPVSVRGGGHSIIGLGVVDDGLVIDLSLMRTVYVDLEDGTVVADGGCVLGDIDKECGLYGLGVPTGLVSHTGLGGLTLGGGIGWLSRSLGLTCDNLVSAVVVLPDESVNHISPTENSDLFWAIQGGGGNFGVVTSMKYKLNPIGVDGFVGFVQMTFLFRKNAKDILSLYSNICSSPETSRNLSIFAFITNQIICLYSCFNGTLEDLKNEISPLYALNPLITKEDTIFYPSLQSMFDEGNIGKCVYWSRSSYYNELPEEMIDILIEKIKYIPTSTNIEIAHIGGIITDRNPEDSAYFFRTPIFEIHSISAWSYSGEDIEEFRNWGHTLFSSFSPYSLSTGYVNFIETEHPSRVEQAYGDNFSRLTSIKSKVDPTNLLRSCVNIPPSPHGQ